MAMLAGTEGDIDKWAFNGERRTGRSHQRPSRKSREAYI